MISTQAEARRPDDLSEYVPTPHAGELIVMRDNGLEIRRIALTRTIFYTTAGEGNYWAAPRAAMSNDGSTGRGGFEFRPDRQATRDVDRNRLRLKPN